MGDPSADMMGIPPEALLQAIQGMGMGGQQPPQQPPVKTAGDVIPFPGTNAQQQNQQGIQRMDSGIANYYAEQQARQKAYLDAIIKGMMKPNLTLIPGGKK